MPEQEDKPSPGADGGSVITSSGGVSLPPMGGGVPDGE